MSSVPAKTIRYVAVANNVITQTASAEDPPLEVKPGETQYIAPVKPLPPTVPADQEWPAVGMLWNSGFPTPAPEPAAEAPATA